MFVDYRGQLYNDGAFIQNGQGRGDLGLQLQTVGFDPALMRPYLNERGIPSVTMNTGRKRLNPKTGRYEPWYVEASVANLRNRGVELPTTNATTLRKDEWVELDRAVLLAARARLSAWADLEAANSYSGFDGMSRLTLEYQAQSDPGEAIIDFDGVTPGRNDTPLFVLRSLPLPIIHSDFFFTQRQIAVSRNSGSPLDTTMAEAAGRRVAETIERLTIGTITGPTFGTNTNIHDGTSTVYGYTNFPDRITKTDLTTPTGTNPEAVMRDVLEMVDLAVNANFFGPFILYHSTAYSPYLSDDYFRSGSTSAVRTLRERIMEIEGISAIRRLDYLTSGYQLILVQMTSDVARAVNGMGITTVQWEGHGGMKRYFKVMAIQVAQLRSDYNGNTGIVHGTTS